MRERGSEGVRELGNGGLRGVKGDSNPYKVRRGAKGHSNQYKRIGECVQGNSY